MSNNETETAIANTGVIPHPKFVTVMSDELTDALDEGFSPMDGLIAIDQVLVELPVLHGHVRRGLLGRLLNVSQTFHGRYDWYPLGFSYRQSGNELHVLDFWMVKKSGLFRRKHFDVVLGADEEFYRRYEPETV